MSEPGDRGPEVAGTVDAARVQAKLDDIEREAAAAAAEALRLRGAAGGSGSAGAGGQSAESAVRSLKYAGQTAIQAMIDIAYHLAAKAFGNAPEDAYDAFDVLARHGVVPGARIAVYRRMIGFRNRLVHGYEDVDVGSLIQLMTAEPSDFAQFRTEVQTFLRARGQTMKSNG